MGTSSGIFATSNFKPKNLKDQTPVNIFQTYLKQNTLVSPIPLDYPTNDFYDIDTEDDLNEFNKQQQARLKEKEATLSSMKQSFKDKVNNIKSGFTDLLSARQPSDKNCLVMSQRIYHDDKENAQNENNQ